MQTLQQLVSSPVLLALCDIPWTPVFLLMIFVFHPVLGWLALGGGALLILLTFLNNRYSREATLGAAHANASAQSFEGFARDQSELVSAQAMLGSVSNRWKKLRQDALSRNLGSADVTGAFTALTKAFRLFLQSAMLAAGAYLVLQAEMTAGAMIAGTILLGRALAPIEQSIGQWPLVQKSITAWSTMKDLLATVPVEPEKAGLAKPTGALGLRGVSYYVAGKKEPILANINFSMKPGEVVGVIGKSGAGKSTLARIILGLASPNAGEVTLGGAGLDQYSKDQLGQAIGYLPQSVTLFPATILETLRAWKKRPIKPPHKLPPNEPVRII